MASYVPPDEHVKAARALLLKGWRPYEVVRELAVEKQLTDGQAWEAVNTVLRQWREDRILRFDALRDQATAAVESLAYLVAGWAERAANEGNLKDAHACVSAATKAHALLAKLRGYLTYEPMDERSLRLRHLRAEAERAELELRRARKAAGEDGADPAAGYWDPARELEATDADAKAEGSAPGDLPKP